MNETEIIVVDSLMGSGKTSWAVQEMDAHPDESYIYCTPFLKEIDRIQKTCKRKFFDPKKINGRKLDGFNYLLMSGRDIALTHSTFSYANEETFEHLSNGNYCLILDEVLDVLVEYNDIANEEISSDDMKLLLNEQFIKVDDYGRVTQQKDSYPGSKYFDVERLAKQGHLFCFDSSCLVWRFSPEIFKTFRKVYVLTYMFEGSILKPYFEYHELPYTLASIERTNTGEYTLRAYADYKEERKKIKSLIHMNQYAAINNYRDESLSKTWFNKAKPKSLKKLQNHIFNYFHNIIKAKSGEILWTCPKKQQKDLKGKGYNVVRNPTKEEMQLPKEELDDLKKKLSCYIPCNTRSTNDYKERKTLAYVINMYPNSYISRYFINKNKKDGTSIKVHKDYFALSCLLQWIWRSQIREGKPINLYLPSVRMRQLLEDWLYGKI